MSLITPKTQLESDLQDKDELVIQCAQAANHLAAVLSNQNVKFWSLPTDRLVAVLNHDVPVTLATFAANTSLGSAVNSILDQLNDPRFLNRAPVVPGRTDIVFGDGSFVFVPAISQPENSSPE
jgi:hypothetical protein